MALRYITGRSGQGKTEYLVKEVIRRSIEIPEKQYYVIVPEQFSLEMQRKIVKMHPRHGFFNIDVLSFHRLSYRIFAECNYQPKEILEDLGVSMMLRKILSEEEGDFLYFKKIEGRKSKRRSRKECRKSEKEGILYDRYVVVEPAGRFSHF